MTFRPSHGKQAEFIRIISSDAPVRPRRVLEPTAPVAAPDAVLSDQRVLGEQDRHPRPCRVPGPKRRPPGRRRAGDHLRHPRAAGQPRVVGIDARPRSAAEAVLLAGLADGADLQGWAGGAGLVPGADAHPGSLARAAETSSGCRSG